MRQWPADPGAVDDGAVSNGNVVAYFGVIVGVDHRAVLDISPTSYGHAPFVGPHDSRRPHAGTLANDNVANNVGRLADPRGVMDLRRFALKAANHRLLPPADVARTL